MISRLDKGRSYGHLETAWTAPTRVSPHPSLTAYSCSFPSTQYNLQLRDSTVGSFGHHSFRATRCPGRTVSRSCSSSRTCSTRVLSRCGARSTRSCRSNPSCGHGGLSRLRAATTERLLPGALESWGFRQRFSCPRGPQPRKSTRSAVLGPRWSSMAPMDWIPNSSRAARP